MTDQLPHHPPIPDRPLDPPEVREPSTHEWEEAEREVLERLVGRTTEDYQAAIEEHGSIDHLRESNFFEDAVDEQIARNREERAAEARACRRQDQ